MAIQSLSKAGLREERSAMPSNLPGAITALRASFAAPRRADRNTLTALRIMPPPQVVRAFAFGRGIRAALESRPRSIRAERHRLGERLEPNHCRARPLSLQIGAVRPVTASQVSRSGLTSCNGFYAERL
jgi:hypothetical protein